MDSPAERRPIVVGVDASAGAAAALRWAVDEARLRGVGLRIVHVFPALRHLLHGSTGAEYYSQLEAEATTDLEGVLAGFPGLAELPNVETEVQAGNAAEILVNESEAADLLVVGSRGLGGFAGVVLGSVSGHCAQLAHCPVVVVREGR